jgi:organic hydroperoxide reductase OsmC/OhrA
MKAFPHHYGVRAAASENSSVGLSAPGLMPLASAPPLEFEGPGDLWSPETLLVAAVSDCFILTFRAIARASNLRWTDLSCDTTGTVERIDSVTRFTAMDLDIHLAVPDAMDIDKAKRLIEKAERACLISNSLKTSARFRAEVTLGEAPLAA